MQGEGIAVDERGRAYVTGQTFSADYPTTPAPSTEPSTAARDAFVTKLNASGSALAYSTFLGGSDSDDGQRHRGGRDGRAYVTGHTQLRRLPHHPRRLRQNLQRQRLQATPS